MKVALISLDNEIFTVGIRILSNCLRKSGHTVKCIFLPRTTGNQNLKLKFQFVYPLQLMNDLKVLCSDVGLIGISLLTNHFLQATQITNYLKSGGISAPIIWGGIEPTVEPVECLQFADMVCIGEGEEALVELTNRLEAGIALDGIPNIWLTKNDQTIRNQLLPLEQDLDSIPLPDYSCIEHFISANDRIIPLSRDVLVNFNGERYRSNSKGLNYPILTSRGCPYQCTYCCNDIFERLYKGQKRLRWRSNEMVINELKMIRDTIAPLECVYFVDDNFTARAVNQLASFCEIYKKEIGAPFFCQVSPLTVSAEKIEVLLDAGCCKIVMGVETANDRIAGLYNRTRSHAETRKAIDLIETYRARLRLPPSYQFIIDNPYESLAETLETLNMAVSLPRPWDNPIYSLMLFPGTTLYEKAFQDGLIDNKANDIYGKNWLNQSQPFFQFWIRLYRANFPAAVLRLLLTYRLVKLLTNRFSQSIWKSKAMRWLWLSS